MGKVQAVLSGHLAAIGMLGAAAAGLPAQAHGEVSANIGVTSNYIWRGVTQSDDGPAIQGGVDFAHPSGFYLGTWASNVDFGGSGDDNEYELDLYGGYSGQAGELGYDIGLIYYAYPLADDANFLELGLSGSWNFLTVGLNYTLDGEAAEPSPFIEGDVYYYANASFELSQGFSVGGTIGSYNYDNPGAGVDDNYVHYRLDLTKSAGDLGDFTFAIDVNDMDGEYPPGKSADDPRVSLSWTKSF